MKQIFYAFFFLMHISLQADIAADSKESKEKNHEEAFIEEKNTKTIYATRGDIKVIEASENIRYLSQKIAKEYLFYYKNPDKVHIKKKLEKTLGTLNENLRMIAMTTKDADTKDILEFLAYSKDQIGRIFHERADKERAALMLDYSEILLEGADSIASAHIYDFTDEEKMLMITKEIEYLMQRVAKYYMAMYVGFGDNTNKKQMHKAIIDIDDNIGHINNYTYPAEIEEKQKKMNVSWIENRYYFQQSESLYIPQLMLSSVDYMENIVFQIALHHNRSQ